MSAFLAVQSDGDASERLESQATASVPAGTGEVDGVRYRPIETYDVCDRVLGENPLVTDEERAAFGPEPDPATWKLLELRCPKLDGGFALCRTVRGPEWLEEQRPEVGGQVYISVPECGIEGNAEVLAMGPCPAVKPGKGRVVTSTFRHEVAGLVEVHVEGLHEPIGCTGNHPFWSEDRQDFVRADALREGETLATLDGTARVTSVTTRPGPQAVYNLEVQGEHVYLVTEAGVLVHNGSWKFCPVAEEAIMLGRFMDDRVIPAAKRKLAGWYRNPPPLPKNPTRAQVEASVEANREWLRAQIRAGKRIFDIGSPKNALKSPWYDAEVKLLQEDFRRVFRGSVMKNTPIWEWIPK